MPPVSSPPLAGITTTGRSIYQTRRSRASHFHGFITRRTAVVGKPQRSRFVRGRASGRNGCGRGRRAWRVRRGVFLLTGVFIILAASNSLVVEAATPLPAGPKPSKLATMVCQKKAQVEIGQALGESAVVSDQTWVSHLYSCEYRYTTGTMVLSIKELSSGRRPCATSTCSPRNSARRQRFTVLVRVHFRHETARWSWLRRTGRLLLVNFGWTFRTVRLASDE